MERKSEQGSEVQMLPSSLQLQDKCALQTLIDIMEDARDGQITKISFLPGKVKYDIQIPIYIGVDLEPGQDASTREPSGYFRIANVDSAFIGIPFTNGFHYNSKRDQEFRNRFDQELVRHTEHSPFANFHIMEEIPTHGTDVESEQVVIDLNGKQEVWATGYYDKVEKEWVIENLKEYFEPEHARYANLPMKR